MTQFRYKAFISYSHRDEPWASWLQRALERYRVPRRLVGEDGEFGEIPANLAPVFRDREDLSSADDLSRQVLQELELSENLIVICSPAAAQSEWVNQEIRHFKSLGREHRVHAVIVDGDPLAVDTAEFCFPQALIEREDGRRREPLAADARKYADGKPLARLKLIAGMLGIRLDDLRRRDMQRRRKTLWTAILGTTAVLAVTGFLAITAISSRQAAQQTQDSTGELLEYMLANLDKLDAIIGVEIIDSSDQQLADMAASGQLAVLSTDELKEEGMAWRGRGQQAQEEGQLDTALEYLRISQAAFVALYQRIPRNLGHLFELGQAEFWVGYIHLDKGDLDHAEAAISRYGAITRRLINAEPRNAEWVMELSYTLTNLGAVENERQVPDRAKALDLLQSALEYNTIAVVLDPDNDIFRLDLSTALAFLADALRDSCNLGQALEYRGESVDITRELFSETPDDEVFKLTLAYSLSGRSLVQHEIGLWQEAIDGWTESESLLQELVHRYPNNRQYLWQALFRAQVIAFAKADAGDRESGWDRATELNQEIDQFISETSVLDFQQKLDYAQFKRRYSELASDTGREHEAIQYIEEAIRVVEELPEDNPDSRIERASAYIEHWRQNDNRLSSEYPKWLDSYLADRHQVVSCREANLGARLAIMWDQRDRAVAFTAYLLGKGYYEPAFVRFCAENGLCSATGSP